MRHAVFQKPHCNKKVKQLLLHERYHYRLLSVETVFGLIKYLIRVRLEHICGYLFTAEQASNAEPYSRCLQPQAVPY